MTNFGKKLDSKSQPDSHHFRKLGRNQVHDQGQNLILADTIDKTPEFEVAPDPRTGPVKENPIRTMDIQLTDSAPDTDLRVKFAGKYYSVPNTNWDREAFIIIYKLFQVTVTDVSAIGIPVTIAK